MPKFLQLQWWGLSHGHQRSSANYVFSFLAWEAVNGGGKGMSHLSCAWMSQLTKAPGTCRNHFHLGKNPGNKYQAFFYKPGNHLPLIEFTYQVSLRFKNKQRVAERSSLEFMQGWRKHAYQTETWCSWETKLCISRLKSVNTSVPHHPGTGSGSEHWRAIYLPTFGKKGCTGM